MSAVETPRTHERFARGSASELLVNAFGSEIAYVWTAKPRRGIVPLSTKYPLRSWFARYGFAFGYVGFLVVEALFSPGASARQGHAVFLGFVAVVFAISVPSALYERATSAYGFDGRRAYIAHGGFHRTAISFDIRDYTVIGKRNGDGSGTIRFEEPLRPRKWFEGYRQAYAFTDVPDVDEIAALLAHRG
jgi:hypothetical protein